MNKIKKGLGRGLSSLIGETKIENKTNNLSISEIIPNKYQPRKNFDDANLEDLTNSIKERGLIQPIIVRTTSGSPSLLWVKVGTITTTTICTPPARDFTGGKLIRPIMG